METLATCRRLFETHGYPLLVEAFPEYSERVAAAHVSGSSDVLGADDEYSKLGVWGATFELFLPEEEFREAGQQLREVMNRSLPREFEGYPTASGGGPPVSVFSIKGYLRERLGLSHFPKNQAEWLQIPEYSLCNFTSGEIFFDPVQELTTIQKRYASYYPADIWKIHLARAAYACWFYGEANFPQRLAPREDTITATIAVGEFCSAVMRLVFLINRQYAPYWKWMHWAFTRLPDYSGEIDPLLNLLVASTDLQEQADYITGISKVLKEIMKKENLVGDNPTLEVMGAYDIMRTLEDPALARQPLR